MYALAYSCIFDHSLKNASPVAQLVKNLPANAGDTRDVGLIPRSGRSPGEESSNPLQYSCLENLMDRQKKQNKQKNYNTVACGMETAITES